MNLHMYMCLHVNNHEIYIDTDMKMDVDMDMDEDMGMDMDGDMGMDMDGQGHGRTWPWTGKLKKTGTWTMAWT
jgi:hypothetical protein